MRWRKSIKSASRVTLGRQDRDPRKAKRLDARGRERTATGKQKTTSIIPALIGLLVIVVALGPILVKGWSSGNSAGGERPSTVGSGSDRRPVVEDQYQEPFYVDLQGNRLYVHTQMMVLGIEGGAITYVQDKASGQVFVDSDAYTNRPARSADFVGFASRGVDSGRYLRRPEPSSSVSCSRVGANTVRLTYDSLYSGDALAAGQLIVDLTVDEASGEVIVQVTGIEAEPSLRPFTVDLPIMSMTPPAVILSSGARYPREDAEATDQTTYPDLGLNSPNMAVVEGSDAVLAAWSETTQFPREYIQLFHTPAYDHLVLHTEQDPKQTTPEVIVSSPWRIGTYPTWVDAARRWRETFEERTGALPLWENRTPWVRNIHAVYNGIGQDYGTDMAKYAELAGIASPEKVLYFLWNGDRIVLLGDHTLVRGIGRPTPEFLAIVEHYGWPLLLYHPYTLINSEAGAISRLGFLADRGWLPNSYQFRPDYDGAPEEWHRHWVDIKVNYSEANDYYLLHPGSSRVKDYLVRNLGHYCAVHGANGAYLDVMGDDNRMIFLNGSLPVVENQDSITGERDAVARIAEALPNVGLMSEYQGQWVLPFIFYSWEGIETHIRQNVHAQTRINHPLRTALIGSYAWTRESNEEYTNDVVAALLGTLPAISLVGDHNVSDETALWSQARGKLFCDEELYNDLPDEWDDDALAYYRSKSGHWWKFVMLGSTVGYVEIMPDGSEAIRLLK